MKMVLYIALGGSLGSVLRYLLSRLFSTGFPLGTMAVNIIGCFLIGFFYGLFAKYTSISPELKALLTVGFCGGFTTFSTFMNDCSRLASLGEYLQVSLYIAISLIVGFAAVYFGQKIWQ